MLSDIGIKEQIDSGNISIEPFAAENLLAGNYKVHLGPSILKPIPSTKIVDPNDKSTVPEYEKLNLEETSYVLQPGEFILGQTAEKIGLNSSIGMFIDGRSTLARLGLTIHQSANYIPAGQDPHIITLEIYNAGIWQVKLTNNMRIGKLVVFKFEQANAIPEKKSNPYNGQQETTGAKF